LSAAGLGITGGLELLLTLFTGSVALLGDALHNLSDVSTSLAVFVGFKVSKREASRHFPYGFERAEDLAGVAVVLVIWVSAIFACYQSYEKLISHTGTSHVWAGILAPCWASWAINLSPDTRHMWAAESTR
jgi:cation diffusion facilitator family transporter